MEWTQEFSRTLQKLQRNDSHNCMTIIIIYPLTSRFSSIDQISKCKTKHAEGMRCKSDTSQFQTPTESIIQPETRQSSVGMWNLMTAHIPQMEDPRHQKQCIPWIASLTLEQGHRWKTLCISKVQLQQSIFLHYG